MKSVPRKVNISSVNDKLSQEPSKSSPSQNLSLSSKSFSRKLFRNFSATFFVVSRECKRSTTSFAQIKDENTKSGSFARSDGQNWIFSAKRSVKTILTLELMIFMLLPSFIVSLISLREIAVPALNIACKNSIFKTNVSLFVGFVM